jgi:broad specificity phosphatase PhoE
MWTFSLDHDNSNITSFDTKNTSLNQLISSNIKLEQNIADNIKDIQELLKSREQNNINTYFVRHGQTDRNLQKLMNPWDVDSELNITGINQWLEMWEICADKNITISTIISSGLSRTKNTWLLIWTEIEDKQWFPIDYINHPKLKEMFAGRLKDYSHEDLEKEFWTSNNVELRKAYKNESNNGVEWTLIFELRVLEGIKETLEYQEWKNVLYVWHSWTARVFKRIIESISIDDAHYIRPTMPNWIVHQIDTRKSEVISIMDIEKTA